MRKTAIEDKARTLGATKGVRVIALKSFTDKKTREFHSYGHEFEHPKGAKLDQLIADKVVRMNDRGASPVPATTPGPPADEGA